MKCNECGVDTPNGAKFCGECGSGLTAVADPSPPQTLPVPMSAEEGQGAWAALSARQRQAVLVVVAGLLITIGFLASFGFSNKTWYGSESLSGTQFAEAGERAWGNEGDPYKTGGPLLELSYLLPVAGLTLLFLGYQRYQEPSKKGGRWITGVAALALVTLIISWAMYFQAFGTYESRPGVGSYLCALGAVLGMWQGRKSWQESAQHSAQATESGVSASPKLPARAAFQRIQETLAVTVVPVDEAGQSERTRFVLAVYAATVACVIGVSVAQIGLMSQAFEGHSFLAGYTRGAALEAAGMSALLGLSVGSLLLPHVFTAQLRGGPSMFRKIRLWSGVAASGLMLGLASDLRLAVETTGYSTEPTGLVSLIAPLGLSLLVLPFAVIGLAAWRQAPMKLVLAVSAAAAATWACWLATVHPYIGFKDVGMLLGNLSLLAYVGSLHAGALEWLSSWQRVDEQDGW